MKKFLATLSFILIIVLFAGCGNTQGNITKELINSTTNKIDNVLSIINNFESPNEETVKLSNNTEKATYPIHAKDFTFGNKNTKTYNQEKTTDLSSLSNSACQSCKEFATKKDNLIQNCNNCKDELQNILTNNIVLNENQLNILKEYNLKLDEMITKLSNCPNCKNILNEIKNNNDNVSLSSNYQTLSTNLDFTKNYFEETNNIVNKINKLFNPNYAEINNTIDNNQDAKNNNYEYSIMPINENNDTDNQNSSNNNYQYNKRMPERFNRNSSRNRNEIIKKMRKNYKTQNNTSNTSNLNIKPRNVRA